MTTSKILPAISDLTLVALAERVLQGKWRGPLYHFTSPMGIDLIHDIAAMKARGEMIHQCNHPGHVKAAPVSELVSEGP